MEHKLTTRENGDFENYQVLAKELSKLWHNGSANNNRWTWIDVRTLQYWLDGLAFTI